MRTRALLVKIYKVIQGAFGGHGIAGFPIIRTVHQFALERLKSDFVIVRGQKMFLDPKDSLNLSIDGIYEEYETELVEKMIQPGDVVVDIGACIGYYTLLFAKLVGENGKVFAFEPDPTNFAILKKNVATNGYKNVVLANEVVSEKTGKQKLYQSENAADHQIYDSHEGRKFIERDGIALDDHFKDFKGIIDVIKMDIQGAEFGAVRGMSRLLDRNRNIKVISEFWPIGLKKSGASPLSYLELFLKRGFKIYEISESQKKLIPVDAESLLKTYTAEKGNYTNLLCTRE